MLNLQLDTWLFSLHNLCAAIDQAFWLLPCPFGRHFDVPIHYILFTDIVAAQGLYVTCISSLEQHFVHPRHAYYTQTDIHPHPKISTDYMWCGACSDSSPSTKLSNLVLGKILLHELVEIYQFIKGK